MFLSLLLISGRVSGQYMDTVCIGTTGTGYHVIGLPGSTFAWTIQGGVQSPVTFNDSILVNWGMTEGVFQVSVVETTAAGCIGDPVIGLVWVTGIPWVSAGPTLIVCSGSLVTLAAADSLDCASVHWTTPGDGTFSNPWVLHPTYAPGPSDIQTGFVILTLTGSGYAASCPSASSTVKVRISTVSATITPTNVTCFGANDGAAFANVTGGIPPFTFQWDDPLAQTSNPAINLQPGTYTVLIRDSALCSTTQSVTLIQEHPTPSALLSLIGGDKVCRGDSVTLRFDLKGTAPWILSYTDGTTVTTVSGIMTSPYIVRIFPQFSCVYTITGLTDAYCTAVPGMLSGSAAVTVFPLPAVEYTWNTTLVNYEIQFHIDSSIVDLGAVGYMVVWNFGDGTFGYGHNPLHLYPGSTTFHCILTVTDTNGCSNSVMHEIFVPPVQNAFYSSSSPTCLGTPMCFEDLSTVPNPPATYITTWIWNYGDGTPFDTIHFPNNPNVCHLYTAVGSYPVSLTIRDNWGTTSTYVHDQVVIPVPVAGFTYSTHCQGQPVQFTDVSVTNGGGSIISWSWDFGDGNSGIYNTSTQQNPAHLFSTGGISYEVRLIIGNFNGCRDTVVRTVYILAAPGVEFTHDSACNGQLVSFTADPLITHVDSIVDWLWDFGDGSVPVTSPLSATHTYTAPGTYVATLTVTDLHGCQNRVSHGVRVNPLPIAMFSWSTPACFGSPVEYTDHSTVATGYPGYIARWLWDFGDGTTQEVILPGSPNVVHTFVGGGMSHTVRLTVWSNDSCSQWVEHVIGSIASPVADFSSGTIHCQGQGVTFTDQSTTNQGGSISGWIWDFGDPGSGTGNTSNLQNPIHTYSTAGTYTVSLVVSSFTGCSDTVVRTVTIGIGPVADFRADTACQGGVTTFTDLSTSNAGTMISYTWNFGDGTAESHLENPTHQYMLSGTYTVTLTVMNSNGCTGDTIKSVVVTSPAVAAFGYSSQSCLGGAVQYTDLSTMAPGSLGMIVKWEWNFGDGTPVVVIVSPGNANVTHTFAGTAPSHVVRLTVTTSEGCTSYTEHTLTSSPSPSADFGYPSPVCSQTGVSFTDQSTSGQGSAIVLWLWNFGDPVSGMNNSSSLENPIHTFTAPGSYTVQLIIANVNGCGDTTQKVILISASPLANFSADTVCLHSPTQFSDLSIAHSSGMIGYTWDFGDGSAVSHLENPSHTYSSYGIHQVKLSVTNSNGCVKDTTMGVLVRPLPQAAFTFSAGGCQGFPVSFTDGSTTVAGYPSSIVKWEWNFGDGTPVVVILAPGNPDVTHTFAGTANAHTVRLTVTTTDGCTDFVDHQVNSNFSPLAGFSYSSGNCAGQAIQFTDNSQSNGGGNITQWKWNFGDPVSGTGNSSTQQNPAHTFSSPGSYSVSEIVYNAMGCSDTIVHTVDVISLPVADFRADTSCVGSPTIFTNLSTGSGGIITQYLWQFGDGGTSTLSSPVHTYLVSGTFQVTLTVTTQAGCTRDTTKGVHVMPLPVASFITSSPACLGTAVTFTDQSISTAGMIQKWEWDFGDGVTQTITYPGSPNTSHVYSQSGSYTAVLKVTTVGGCSSSVTHPVVVQGAPVANYTYSSGRCQMSPVQFTDQTQSNGGSPVTQWLWNFGDPLSGSSNLSTLQNPVHSFSASGSYNVMLSVSSATGCVSSITRVVTVSASPVAQFTSDTACKGSPTQFMDHSVANAPGIVSWNWNFGDPASGTGNVSTLKNPSHVFTSAGVYMVRLSIINTNLCTNDTLMPVVVSQSPQAMFSFSSSCVNSPTQFTDLSVAPNSQLSSWLWDFGDGTGSSTLQNPSYTYSAAGTYNVKLRVTNTAGCRDSVVIPVVSYPLPQAGFSYTNFFCPAGQVTFHDQSQGNGSSITGRLWIFEPGSTSTLHDPTYVFPVTDTNYLVTLIVTDDKGCEDTLTKSVYVKPGFMLSFTHDSVCFSTPTHFHARNDAMGDSLYFVQWNFGDPASGSNNTSTQRNPTHVFTSSGSFVVKLKAWDSDNCVDSVYRNVIVRGLPKPAYTFVSAPCDSVSVFTDGSTPGSGTIASWVWNFGDGTAEQTLVPPSQGDITHVFANAGTYGVTLKVTNSNGCWDTVSHLVTRSSCITAAFTQVTPQGCSDSPVRFTDNSSPVGQINQWHWLFGDGRDTVYTTYAHTITHSYGSSGSYPVTLIIRAGVSGQTFTDTARRMVTISRSPQAGFLSGGVCLNAVSLFKDQSNGYGTAISMWRWSFGDPASGVNNSSSLKDPTHHYTKAGRYTVSLVVVNSNGCRDSISKVASVHALPDARFINTLACSDNPTYFFDQSVAIDTSIAGWHWNFGVPQTSRDSSTQKDPVYEYKKAGNYDVQLTVRDNNGCYDTVDSTVTVNPTPLAAFMVIDNVSNMTGKIQLRNKSEGADSYYWDLGNGYTTTEENPVMLYKDEGIFTIMLISSNHFGCADTTFYKYEVMFKGLYVPNAFVPGSELDGVREFKPVGINLIQYRVEVFDSWGHKLWESTALDEQGRPKEGWKGRRDDGSIYQQGTYVWKITAMFLDGTIWEGSDVGKGEYKTIGTVTLIR